MSVLFILRLVLVLLAFVRTVGDDSVEVPGEGGRGKQFVNPDLLLLTHCPGGISAISCTAFAIWIPEILPTAFVLALLWRPEGEHALAVLGPEILRLAEAGE